MCQTSHVGIAIPVIAGIAGPHEPTSPHQALGIAIKLTLRGSNQLQKRETYLLITVCAMCIATQMNYLNKAPPSMHLQRPT